MSIIIDKSAIEAAFAKWTQDTSLVEEPKPTAPVFALLGEAVDVAAMFDAHWKSRVTKQGVRIPGFEDTADKAAFDEDTGREIFELQASVARAQANYLTLVESSGVGTMQRSEFVVAEIRSALSFLFDDEQETDDDLKLARLNTEFAKVYSHDAMALALDAYATLGDQYHTDLSALGAFDPALLDEAHALAGTLRMRSAEALNAELTNQVRAALATRDRLIALLVQRIRRVRRAARYVFRGHPAIVKNFTSSYDRNRRLARARAKSAAEASAAAVGLGDTSATETTTGLTNGAT